MRVLKNNLISLLIHIFISLLFIGMFYFEVIRATYATREAALSHHEIMMVPSIIAIFLIILLYHTYGWKYLSNQGNFYKNLLSNSLTAAIGIAIWVISFRVDFNLISGNLFCSEWPPLYNLYNGYSLLFLHAFRINNHYLFLLFLLLPVISMSVGMFKIGHNSKKWYTFKNFYTAKTILISNQLSFIPNSCFVRCLVFH